MDFKQYRRDCATIFRLGLPVLVGQVGMILTGFADNIMVGHYSTAALASASFVNNLFNLPIFCAMGFSYGLTPLVGAMFTQGRTDSIGRVMRAGMAANVLMGLLLITIMLVVYFNLDKLGQPVHLLPIIRPYFLIVLVGLLPMCVFSAFSQWSYGVKNTSMPMWILLSANIVNVIGNYILIYGHFGAPELGLTGAGISTLVARILCAVVIMGVFLLRRCNRGYARAFVGSRISREMLGGVVSVSWPVCLQMTFETASFSGCAVFCGWLGEISMAAFQVVIVISTLGFCFYYAIGTSVSVLVANEAGRASREGMRRIAFAGYAVTVAIAFCSCLFFGLFARQLMGVFSDDSAVLVMATGVIFPLILYQLGDATQINFANALRGTANVRPMMWIAFFSYIVVGLPAAWAFAFPLGLGLYGIVLSFSLPLFTAGALFLFTFLHTTRSNGFRGTVTSFSRDV